MNPEIKYCPRCGQKMACNNYNILKCACALVPLNADARQIIAENYIDCLCVDCLREIAQKNQEGIKVI